MAHFALKFSKKWINIRILSFTNLENIFFAGILRKKKLYFQINKPQNRRGRFGCIQNTLFSLSHHIQSITILHQTLTTDFLSQNKHKISYKQGVEKHFFSNINFSVRVEFAPFRQKYLPCINVTGELKYALRRK